MTQPQWFAAVLARYPRVGIVGGPRTGKTTLAGTVTDRPVVATDDYMALPWAEVPGAVVERAAALGGTYVVEGVQTARALRKGLALDAIVVLQRPKAGQTPGQASMAKGVMTVLADALTSKGRNTAVIMEPV